MAIDEDIFHTFGKAGRLRICCRVLNGIGIEDCDIGKIALLEQATIEQAFALSGQGRHFTNSLFKRQQVQIPDVTSKETGHGPKSSRVGVRFKERSIER